MSGVNDGDPQAYQAQHSRRRAAHHDAMPDSHPATLSNQQETAMIEKAYSINDEDFQFLDAEDALAALADEGRLEVGAVYYEIDTEPFDIGELLDAESILESAEERAYDELGECAEDCMSCSRDAIKELQDALDAWASKHLKGQYWRCVGKSRELRVTAEDLPPGANA